MVGYEGLDLIGRREWRLDVLLEFHQLSMLRIGWWIEAYANGLIEVAKEYRRRIRFCARVGHVEVSANFAHREEVS